jgi:hypothetical protein
MSAHRFLPLVALLGSLLGCADAAPLEHVPHDPRPHTRVPLPRPDGAPAAPDAGVPVDAAVPVPLDAAPAALCWEDVYLADETISNGIDVPACGAASRSSRTWTRARPCACAIG